MEMVCFNHYCSKKAKFVLGVYQFALPLFQSLRVSNYLSGKDQSEFTVKVLTCDSISQAKRKIVDVAFMNICQSHRPALESIDIGKLCCKLYDCARSIFILITFFSSHDVGFTKQCREQIHLRHGKILLSGLYIIHLT